jgi:hypothetical protein
LTVRLPEPTAGTAELVSLEDACPTTVVLGPSNAPAANAPPSATPPPRRAAAASATNGREEGEPLAGGVVEDVGRSGEGVTLLLYERARERRVRAG